MKMYCKITQYLGNNNKTTEVFTKGKLYDVVEYPIDYYGKGIIRLLNNFNKEYLTFKNNFISITELREDKLKRILK